MTWRSITRGGPSAGGTCLARYAHFVQYSVQAWRDAGRLVPLLGRRIFVVDSGGPGLPLLLIHGFPTSSWDWAPVWDELATNRRVVAFDLLGFGFSDKPRPHTYSIHEQADLTEALVDSLRLESFDVLAHDYGDTVAQELLARQNAGVGVGAWRTCALLNGGLFPETHQARPIQKLLLGPLGPLVNRLTTRRMFDRSFSAVFGPDTKPSREELAAFWSLIQHNEGLIFHRLIKYMDDRIEHRSRWVRALRDSVVPVGLINGSADPVSGAHMVARYRELIRAGDFIVELPRIGHYPQVEAPEQVLRAYRDFLERATA